MVLRILTVGSKAIGSKSQVDKVLCTEVQVLGYLQ